MADNDLLDWASQPITIHVDADYRDGTPTTDLVVTPDTDLTTVANQKATEILTKRKGKDVRMTLAQWLELCGELNVQGIDTLHQMKLLVQNFQDSIEKRTGDVEKHMTTQEATYKDLITQLTDADKGDGAAEVIAARASSLYGPFDSLAARLDAAEARTASLVPDMDTLATIPVNLGRQVPISVTYYEYAIGTETDGLGTGPYGLGGSTPAQVTVTTTWPDANTAQVAVPVAYADVIKDGTLKTMADGSWTITSTYKTLRLVADA